MDRRTLVSTSRPRRLMPAVLAGVFVVGFVVLVGHESEGVAGGGLNENAATVSNTGRAVKGKAGVQLRGREFGLVRLMAKRNGTAYYHVTSKRGDACYGRGPTQSLGRVGVLKCWAQSRPLMDLSVVEVSRVHHEIVFIGIKGIAADGVATVVITDADGGVLAETAVTQNIYDFRAVPSGVIQGLSALDSSRGVVYSLTFGRS